MVLSQSEKKMLDQFRREIAEGESKSGWTQDIPSPERDTARNIAYEKRQKAIRMTFGGMRPTEKKTPVTKTVGGMPAEYEYREVPVKKIISVPGKPDQIITTMKKEKKMIHPGIPGKRVVVGYREVKESQVKPVIDQRKLDEELAAGAPISEALLAAQVKTPAIVWKGIGKTPAHKEITFDEAGNVYEGYTPEKRGTGIQIGKKRYFGKKVIAGGHPVWEHGEREVTTKREFKEKAAGTRKLGSHVMGALKGAVTKREYNRSPNWFAVRQSKSGKMRSPRQFSGIVSQQKIAGSYAGGTSHKFEVGSPAVIRQTMNVVDRPSGFRGSFPGMRESVTNVITKHKPLEPIFTRQRNKKELFSGETGYNIHPEQQSSKADMLFGFLKPKPSPQNYGMQQQVSKADELFSFVKKKSPQYYGGQQPLQSTQPPLQPKQTGLEFMKRRKIKWY